jgi:hypothetical protein
MSRPVSVFMILIVSATLLATAGVAQERSQGISVHMLPKRVAEIGGMAWGFSVDRSPRLKAESHRVVIHTVADILSYIRKQDTGVQENGLWIVVTDPDSYSEEEKALLEDVKQMCRSENIPLFICRALNLPNGWRRFDR